MNYVLRKEISIEVVIDAYDKEEAIQQFEEATVGMAENFNELEENFNCYIDEGKIDCKDLDTFLKDKMEDDDGF